MDLLTANKAYIERFCNPEALEIALAPNAPEEVVSQTLPFAQILMPLAGLIKIEDEIKRLEQEVVKLEKEVDRVVKKLSNQGFVAKAPAAVVEAERAKQVDYEQQLAAVQERIAHLRQL